MAGFDAAPWVINAGELAVDASEFPISFVATAVKVYAVPSVKPVHIYVVAFPPTVQVAPAGEEVIV